MHRIVGVLFPGSAELRLVEHALRLIGLNWKGLCSEAGMLAVAGGHLMMYVGLTLATL